MEIPFAGTITIDDTLKPLVVPIIRRDTRAAYDLTGVTEARLVASSRNNPANTIDVVMTITAPPTLGVVTVSDFLGGIALGGVQEIFEGEVELFIGADKTYTDPLTFAVRKRRV